MPANTKALKTDVAPNPAPQYFNTSADDYEYLLGRNGANRVEVYGPDGNPLGTTSGKLHVRASEMETLLGALDAAAVVDPAAASAALSQLLRGVLKQMQGNGTGSLPVAGTMSISQATPGTSNGVTINGRKASVVSSVYDQTLNVAAGGNTTITITPGAGELWRIKNMGLEIAQPAGASSGTHEIRIYVGNVDERQRVLRDITAYTVAIVIISNAISNAQSTGTWPTSEAAQIASLSNVAVTAASPLKLWYSNSTNAAQTGTLYLAITKEVEQIVS